MSSIPDNIRLKELVIVANLNKPFFDDLIIFLQTEGYVELYEFVKEQDVSKAKRVIKTYFERKIPNNLKLYDGIARPYSENKAKWLLLGWIFRDAPEQRLKGFLKSFSGTQNERKAELINQVRQYAFSVLPERERWDWLPIFEVMIDRLEGSRRSIKGNLFEEIVRRNLNEIFVKNNIELLVDKTQIKLDGETYDIKVSGKQGTILIPVKTRETMGGGHALLFTRDIHKAISVASQSGYECIPIIIAESWTGNLNQLNCQNVIHIDKNPNQVNEVEPILIKEFERLLEVFRSFI
ncbi:hypothetical protein C7H19_22090 [Aphanothece hegewaldii CCALA 016]|uniref:Uncharacterized protein n=1 Tax=Aphanothece hegewaldii CCALA 016 TaxID=2107694 RepID=A0A2T1LRX0_9CHRO|nr:hypothetical protein [Aphanothece hegewaldii]PSF31989.1 hypothetical protein C7H19_22090 [Aphanothece hegewaldii CCALA 016]